jgi:hypothetical protein
MSEEMNVTKENELSLVRGLLDAANFKNNEELLEDIKIKRKEKTYFQFKIHPISEEDLMAAKEKAVVKMANPMNPKLPPIEKEMKMDEFSAWKIYYATVNGKEIWENPQVLKSLEANGYPVFHGADVINKVLMAGEKEYVDSMIDKISGYYTEQESLEDYAKN